MEDLSGSSGEARAISNEIAALQPAAAFVPTRPCRITLDGLDASTALKIEVRAWLDKLGELTAPMTAGHVAIESVNENRKQLLYRVHMQFTMPAGVVLVGLDHPSNGVHEDIYVAIRNGFRAARRELAAHLTAA
jgi:hypothetical protein